MDSTAGYLSSKRLSGNEFGLHNTEVLIEKGKTCGTLAV